MRKVTCLFAVLVGFGLAGCSQELGPYRMARPPIDAVAALIVTFGVLGLACALRRK